MPNLKKPRIKPAPIINSLAALTVLIMMAFAFGCSINKPLVLPESVPQEGRSPVLEDMIELLSRREEAIKSFSGIANIVLTKDGISEGIGSKIFYRKPKQLRFETLGFMGLTTMVLVTDEKGFIMYFPAYGLAIKDELRNLHLNEMFETPIDLTLDDILSSATGGTNFGEIETNGSTLESEKGNFIISLRAKDGSREKIWFERESKTLTLKELFDPNGHLKARVVFSDPYRVDGIVLHRRIDITKPEDGSIVSINYKKISLNPEIEQDTFILSLAPEVTLYGWEEWNSYSEKR